MLEKEINGKTYARVGDPTNTGTSYFKKNDDGTYNHIAHAQEPQKSFNITSTSHNLWTGEQVNPKHIVDTINPERKIKRADASMSHANPAFQPNATKEDIKPLDDMRNKIRSSNNPNAEKNRKKYFNGEDVTNLVDEGVIPANAEELKDDYSKDGFVLDGSEKSYFNLKKGDKLPPIFGEDKNLTVLDYENIEGDVDGDFAPVAIRVIDKNGEIFRIPFGYDDLDNFWDDEENSNDLGLDDDEYERAKEDLGFGD